MRKIMARVVREGKRRKRMRGEEGKKLSLKGE